MPTRWVVVAEARPTHGGYRGSMSIPRAGRPALSSCTPECVYLYIVTCRQGLSCLGGLPQRVRKMYTVRDRMALPNSAARYHMHGR